MTPPDQSPAKGFGEWKFNPNFDFGAACQTQGPNGLLLEADLHSLHDYATPHHPLSRSIPSMDFMQPSSRSFPTFEPFQERLSVAPPGVISIREPAFPSHVRQDSGFSHPNGWPQSRLRASSVEWSKPEDRRNSDSSAGYIDTNFSPPRAHHGAPPHEVSICTFGPITLSYILLQPINFLSLLHPSASPPYELFVGRIIKSSDQQASIFLQQKLKVADGEERTKIVSAICTRGYEMMAHR